MKKFGLIGHPIAHSLSPVLFKTAYGGRYTYDLIEGDDFEKSYEIFLKEYDAINVTAPFKEKACAKADIRSQECEATGAANILIKREDGQIEAANSDITGVLGSITSGISTQGMSTKALIVGCGGAAMAAAYATCMLGYETVILNRNIGKAQEFAKKLSQVPGFKVSAGGLDSFRRAFRKAGVIVYTLPLATQQLDDLTGRDIKGGLFGKERKIILEANYKDPAFTPEIQARMCRQNHKLTFISGKEWLLHQAVGAYRIFTGEDPDIEAMKAVI